MDKKELERAFAGLGLDFPTLFPTTGPYEAHEWIVKDVAGFGTVLNAVPPDSKLRSLPWEEWYIHQGKRHHHVLYVEKPPRHDEIFRAPDHDEVHPPRTLGKSWYVIDDPDMRPVLLRASGTGS
jgi:hypothetical protein